MQIAYIHGFNSSHRSFAYLQHKLPSHDIVNINYNSHQPIRDSIDEVRRKLPKDGEFYLVGHSLGGILAVLAAAERLEQVKKVVTVSSPFGGSRVALALRWVPGHPKIIEDLTPTSGKIELLSQLKLSIPTMCIISTGGSLPFANEPNDSVVTVSSQRALKFGRKVEISANHFEVLLHDKLIDQVTNFCFGDTA